MTLTALSSRRARKLRRPQSLGEIGWSSHKSNGKILFSPPGATLTGPIYHRYTANVTDFETQSSSPSLRQSRGRSTSPKPHIFGERALPTAYASLPPSPILPHSFTPPPSIPPIPQTQSYANVQPQEFHSGPPFSLWDYLREELLATDFDSHQELKWERVRNFLQMPLAMEKVSISI